MLSLAHKNHSQLPTKLKLPFLRNYQCCGSGMFFSEFLPASRVKKAPDHGSGSATKNLSILTQNLNLSSRKYEAGYLFRIPDPRSVFFPSQIPGSKKHRIYDQDPQHWKICRLNYETCPDFRPHLFQ